MLFRSRPFKPWMVIYAALLASFVFADKNPGDTDKVLSPVAQGGPPPALSVESLVDRSDI